MQQGQGIAIIFYALKQLLVGTWKFSNFTGAWVLVGVVGLASLIGPSPLIAILFIAGLVFCVFWTLKNVARRQHAHQSAYGNSGERPLYAPPRQPQGEHGLFYREEEYR
jgi:hypothetical protein